MSATVSVSREQVGYEYGVHPDPIRIVSGDTVVIETFDARAGALRDREPGEPFELTEKSPIGRSNPLSGPIAVEGARPGDVLAVHILDIETDSLGWAGAKTSNTVLAPGRIPESIGRACLVDRDMVQFTKDIAIPAAPMIGCIGTASPGSPIPSELPGRHGGNMDQKVVAAGATVYLPVFHDDAYLYLGDVHAAQGDGELSGVGLEIAAKVTATVELVPGLTIDWPWLRSSERLMILTSAPDFPTARREAVDGMVTVMEQQLNLSPAEALALISIVGDLRVGQACGGMDMTVRLEVPTGLGLTPG